MNIYDRPTPRTDECYITGYGWEIKLLATLCRRLEQELETCRDAHMANCLASDTLRREIAELRARNLAALRESTPE
jgi:hypothetical protein